MLPTIQNVSPPTSPRGSMKRGLLGDANQDPMAKHARLSNPEFLAAFRAFDPANTGFMDISGLNSALQAVKVSVEAGTQHCLQNRPFQASTCCFLLARFGTGGRLTAYQWCELLDYLQNLKSIFMQVDADHSGAIEFAELHRAFQVSGVHIDPAVVVEVGKSYDGNGDGGLEFDEFVQMLLEWDYYVNAWDQSTQGGATIAPQQLLDVLEKIKLSVEPLGALLGSQEGVPLATARGIVYASQFGQHKPFHINTCERLIVRFGQGCPFLNFGQFCSMMVFLKEMKAAFSSVDSNGSGGLNMAELCNVFTRAGLNLPDQLIMQIGQSFDSDNSGEIEFDEFIQIAAEWQEMLGLQGRFVGSQGAATLNVEELQQLLGTVRVFYQVINGAVQSLRAFSLNTCRWLIAKFGTCQVGDRFARGVSYPEFLSLVQYLKECYEVFLRFDVDRSASVNLSELFALLAACGLSLSPEAVDNIRLSYDKDQSGTLEFDEFVEMLLEVQLYDQCFTARERHPSILSPLNTANPILGQQLSASQGPGLVTLDRSAFFAMVYALPRSS
mmetsp:Transcript_63148/g.113670  ORF Transcript_63148/g.113670 Transcript_63148/m.113670 type:complete len:555 (-) Transcript_63148:67-1731(-)